MKLWIVKDLLIGYQYNSNKQYRKILFDYFNYVYNVISSKGNKNDYFIISSGLFNSINPNIIAINDAITFIKKLSSQLNVIIINSKNDVKKYDNNLFSVIDILHDINNVSLIKEKTNINDIFIIPTNIINTEINAIISDENILKLNDININIPSAIAFTDKIDNIGILILDLNNNKYITIKNNQLPKHIKIEINEFNDFDNINTNTIDYIHLIINNKLKHENEFKLNMLISNLNPTSFKFINNDIISNENNKTYNFYNIDIVNLIKNEIDNDDVLNQFDRILKINNV